MTNHVYQFGTIADLRKRYEDNSHAAETAHERAQYLLGNARAHAALAHDAALFLDIADPEWKAECETPIVARLLRLRAWREMLDLLEAHPEIGIGGYESISIEQPNGESATPEFLESLKPLGIKVERGAQRVHAELWFGDHDVRLSAYAKIEPPAEPVDEDRALNATLDSAIEAADQLVEELAQEVAAGPADEPQSDEEKFHLGDIVIVVKPGELAHLAKGQGRVVDVNSDGPDGFRFGVQFPGDGDPYILYYAAEQLAPPIQPGDRVRLRDAGRGNFPTEYHDREGVVTEVEPGAFSDKPDAGDDEDEDEDEDDEPIVVLLDGDTSPTCFAVAEVSVLTPATDVEDCMAGQPA